MEDEKAEELVSKCPVNVFDIEDIGEGKSDLLFGADYELLYLTVVRHSGRA